ncbi:MAG: methionine synthase [Solirubrobacterales bacterium]
MDKNEVLRYLGYKNQVLDDNMNSLINSCLDEINEISEEKYLYNSFNITGREDGVSLNNGVIELKGNSIKKHLENSKTCVLMCVSIGSNVDKRIRYYEKTDMPRAVILDAWGTVAVEELCDKVCSIIEAELEEGNLNSRFSPGYGDLTISIQKKFLKVLDAEKKIGLTATESCILIPRKSVTAIAGVVSGKCISKKSCKNCSNSECAYRREEK